MKIKKGTVLIIEDDKVDQLAFERFSHREKFPYDCIIASSVKEARNILEDNKFTAVVLDYLLGDGTAFDLFSILKDTPVIIVTGKGDEELAVQLMKHGVYDYLIKDMWGSHITKLQMTIDRAIEKKRLEDLIRKRTLEIERINRKIKKINLQLKKQALIDGLTGIANYRKFSEVYNTEWRRSIRNGTPISIILIDVDFFKFFNDSYGHQAGDDCLRKIAQKIKALCKRPADLAARYGGEEFIVVLSENDAKGTVAMAEKLRLGIEGLKINHATSTLSKYITISLGCATIIPKNEDDPAMLIKAADQALYRSKESGRNRVSLCDPGLVKTSSA